MQEMISAVFEKQEADIISFFTDINSSGRGNSGRVSCFIRVS
jgi:hypothetical protein